LTILFAATFTAKAQWIQGDGIYGGCIMSLAVSGDNIYAGSYSGVFLSTNNATSWSQTALDKISTQSLLPLGDNLFAGTTGGAPAFYRSSDHGRKPGTQKSLASIINIFYCLGCKWEYLSFLQGTHKK